MRLVLLLLAALWMMPARAQDGLHADPVLVLEPGMHTAMINRLNADAAGHAFALPEPALAWTLVLDSAHPDREEHPVQDEAVPVGPRSVVLLAAKLPPA